MTTTCQSPFGRDHCSREVEEACVRCVEHPERCDKIGDDCDGETSEGCPPCAEWAEPCDGALDSNYDGGSGEGYPVIEFSYPTPQWFSPNISTPSFA